MFKYVCKRVVFLFFVMFGVSLLTFGMVHLTPGDPAEILLRMEGINATPEAVEALREKLGLNNPLPVQYGHWISKVLGGDLGVSFETGRPVLEELGQRLPATVELTVAGTMVVLLVSLPLGLLSAVYKNTLVDHIGRFFALVGASVPSFWLGLILIYFLAVKYQLLPVMGRGSPAHLVLPALTLGLGMSATYARLLRASMLEILGLDFIQAARARGLTENAVLLGHAFKNALLPLVTAFGMSLGHLLGGTVIVETIFAWPGMGHFLVDSIFGRDYAVVQSYVLLMAFIFVILNLLVDISYAFIDPRMRVAKKGEDQ
ncbi:nickel ABC transporter permease [Desulfosporosinus meridiei]|uniref:Nickel import system permease protein NikB n=1 Tax=Desulfosporosinus meridiei (strain ATCC BAA-275 / DSM 13257 / KCTC 12902 / NCIMB 13706 / S10) TaxID=768704 RepID=J7IV67_DESMD|nr:nickel ABC transporter permease [Desulfosporosinus meridiei]AFQ42601.1 ABC-type dipeptide/oligopeptide/nickel transport system, permease component [Desulfosporosinus meridiei DSM 13257]